MTKSVIATDHLEYQSGWNQPASSSITEVTMLPIETTNRKARMKLIMMASIKLSHSAYVGLSVILIYIRAMVATIFLPFLQRLNSYNKLMGWNII